MFIVGPEKREWKVKQNMFIVGPEKREYKVGLLVLSLPLYNVNITAG